MRLVFLMLSLTTLSSCAASYTEPPQPQTQSSTLSFATQRYPNQTDQCSGEVKGERGTIQWVSATTVDSIASATKYYNRQTGIAKRRTKRMNIYGW